MKGLVPFPVFKLMNLICFLSSVCVSLFYTLSAGLQKIGQYYGLFVFRKHCTSALKTLTHKETFKTALCNAVVHGYLFPSASSQLYS